MLYLQRKKKNAFLTTQIKDIEECPPFTNFTIYLSYGVLFFVGYIKEFFYPPSTKETNREVECTGEGWRLWTCHRNTFKENYYIPSPIWLLSSVVVFLLHFHSSCSWYFFCLTFLLILPLCFVLHSHPLALLSSCSYFFNVALSSRFPPYYYIVFNFFSSSSSTLNAVCCSFFLAPWCCKPWFTHISFFMTCFPGLWSCLVWFLAINNCHNT